MERTQKEIINGAVVAVREVMAPFVGTRITLPLWLRLLRLLFGIVSPAAKQVAEVSRDFYDSERYKAFPGAPRHDVFLSELKEDRFLKDMSPLKSQFTSREVTSRDVDKLALRAARSIENSGRWTIMHAVETPDPYFESGEYKKSIIGKDKSSIVRGWARVATGDETCSWCLILVSRGAVYYSARTAGSKFGDRDSMQMVGAGEFDPEEHMSAWHDGCDCKVVPVFNLKQWAGKGRFLAAQKMWKEVTKGLHGKDAMNAFRRATEAGEYTKYLSKF